MLRITLAAAFWIATAQLVSAQPVTLKLSFFTSDQNEIWTLVLKPFIDAVNAESGGAVKIQGFPNGALGRNLPQQPQMVLDGVADIAFVTPSLSSGRFPDDTLFEVPGLVRNLAEGTRLVEGLIASNSLRGYSDYVVLGSFMNSNLNIHARRPIKSISDLKGMKVRILGPVIGQTVKELGMVPVLMPPNEVVEAMGRGTIDAVAISPPAFFDFGMERVASSVYFLNLGTNSFAILMNRSKFDALPKQAQDVIMKHSGREFGERFIKEIGASWIALMERFKNDSKRLVVFPSDADQIAADAIFANVAREWAAKEARNDQLLTKARAMLEDIHLKYP
jgi:TRAP-type transport system periplasmic protein